MTITTDMRPIAFIFAFILISISSFCQVNTFKGEKAEHFYKMEKYHKMKSTGTGLTIAGGALVVAGVIVMANSSIDEVDDGTGNTKTVIHGHPIGGFLMVLGGHAAVGAGIPLWTIGAAKEKKYQKKFEQVSFNFINSPIQHGVRFTFRF